MVAISCCIHADVAKAKKVCQKKRFQKPYMEYQIMVWVHGEQSKKYYRYQQLYEFNKSLKDKCLKSIFPPKRLFNMKSEIIQKRINAIRQWLQILLEDQMYRERALKFLGFSQEIQLQFKEDKTCRECQTCEFTKSIFQLFFQLSYQPHKKTSALHAFDRQFFSGTGQLNSYKIRALIYRLCQISDEVSIAAKVIMILRKLTQPDYFRFFEIAIQEFINLDIQILQGLRLQNHIMNKIYGDSQLSALELFDILVNYYNGKNGDIALYIISYNDQAIQKYIQWKNQQYDIQLTNQHSIDDSSWLNLNCQKYPGNLQYRYRVNQSLLEIVGQIEINARQDQIRQFLLNLDYRKQWDSSTYDSQQIDSQDQIWMLVWQSDEGLFESSVQLTTSLSSDGVYYIWYKPVDCQRCVVDRKHCRISIEGRYAITPVFDTEIECENGQFALEIRKENYCIVEHCIRLHKSFAKLVTGDLAEETSFLKDSMKVLKERIEEGQNTIDNFGCKEIII